LDEVIDSSIKQAMRLFEHCAENIWITRYLPTERRFEIAACYRDSEKVEVGQDFPHDRTIAGWMLQNRGEILFSNNLREKGIESFVKSVKACISYPIMFGDEFFGIFTVASSRTGVFTDADKKQLELLGAQVTQAFANARRFEQTRREQQTLREYFQCLDKIANLPPPWEPHSVTERVCSELRRLGFATIRAEVRDNGEEEISHLGWEKVSTADSYQESDCSGLSGDECFTLRLCDLASGDTATATVYLSPREGETAFTPIDRLCLGLAERLAAGRLRDEAELASTVSGSIGASTHGLRSRVANVRDKIDGILDDSSAFLSESVRPILGACQEQLQSALEWCQTSELLTQYRRGSCPKQEEFSQVALVEYLPSLLETCEELLGWEFDVGDVPRDTLVKVHLPGLRRIVGDLVRNAEEHGVRNGPRKVTLTLLREVGGERVRVAVCNMSEDFDSDMANDLQEKARTPERMAFNSSFGIGTLLAAVIAKMHGGSLEVRAEGDLVTFSFSLPVSAFQ
jgi:K+-sensing histidine kinase KdpD